MSYAVVFHVAFYRAQGEQHKSCSLRVSSAAMRIARKACLGEAKRRREAGEKLVTNATGTAGGPGH